MRKKTKRKYFAPLRERPTLLAKDRIDELTKEVKARREKALAESKVFAERDTTGTQRPHSIGTKDGRLRYAAEIDEQFKEIEKRYEGIKESAESK